LEIEEVGYLKIKGIDGRLYGGLQRTAAEESGSVRLKPFK
jgi:hypothetical protein